MPIDSRVNFLADRNSTPTGSLLPLSKSFWASLSTGAGAPKVTCPPWNLLHRMLVSSTTSPDNRVIAPIVPTVLPIRPVCLAMRLMAESRDPRGLRASFAGSASSNATEPNQVVESAHDSGTNAPTTRLEERVDLSVGTSRSWRLDWVSDMVGYRHVGVSNFWLTISLPDV